MAQCASLGKKTAWFMAVSPYRGAYMPKKVGTCYVCNNRSPTLWRNNAYYDTFRGTTVVPTRPCNACPAGKATKAGATAAVQQCVTCGTSTTKACPAGTSPPPPTPFPGCPAGYGYAAPKKGSCSMPKGGPASSNCCKICGAGYQSASGTTATCKACPKDADASGNAVVRKTKGNLPSNHDDVSDCMYPTCHKLKVSGNPGFCTETCPCYGGEGSCDLDPSQVTCGNSLTCVKNIASLGFAKGLKSVCVDRSKYTATKCAAIRGKNGGRAYCSALCPCSHGEGDCRGDSSLCKGASKCMDGVGVKFSLPAGSDVCIDSSKIDCKAIHSYSNGHKSFCSVACPCVKGEGSCDLAQNGLDCAKGLKCTPSVGAYFGLNPLANVCLSPNWRTTDMKNADGSPMSCHGTISPGSKNPKYCSRTCPCKKYEGSCEQEAGDCQCLKKKGRVCMESLKCTSQVASYFGFADATTNVCLPRTWKKPAQQIAFKATGSITLKVDSAVLTAGAAQNKFKAEFAVAIKSQSSTIMAVRVIGVSNGGRRLMQAKPAPQEMRRQMRAVTKVLVTYEVTTSPEGSASATAVISKLDGMKNDPSSALSTSIANGVAGATLSPPPPPPTLAAAAQDAEDGSTGAVVIVIIVALAAVAIVGLVVSKGSADEGKSVEMDTV